MAGCMRPFWGDQGRRAALALLTVSLAAIAAPAAAQTAPDTRFEDGSRVQWTAQPSPSDVWAAMRSAGLSRSDVDEWAVVVCMIADNRRLTDCEILRQSSDETEVGEALLDMTPRYRAASTDRAGQSSIGRRVYIAMGYGGVAIP